MNLDKQHLKLMRLSNQAKKCLTRKEAQKIIRKADKVLNKIGSAAAAAA